MCLHRAIRQLECTLSLHTPDHALSCFYFLSGTIAFVAKLHVGMSALYSEYRLAINGCCAKGMSYIWAARGVAKYVSDCCLLLVACQPAWLCFALWNIIQLTSLLQRAFLHGVQLGSDRKHYVLRPAFQCTGHDQQLA